MINIIATRLYDFAYFHDLFFNHYKNMNLDILVFCKKEHLQDIKYKHNDKKVFFFELPEHQIPYVYEEEKFICNWIYQETIKFYELNYLEFEATILFADDDEYYTDICVNSSISRVVFFEWYQSPIQELSANEFYNLVIEKQCKGKLLTLWNDPFYKESIIRISSQNIEFFKKCKYSSAFHRLLYCDKIHKVSKNTIFANHLKGIPLRLAQERISNIKNLIKKTDDWCSNHYTFEYQKFHVNYYEFFNNLFSYNDLMNDTQNRLEKFENDVSFFETKVLPFDWNTESENTPSLIFKKND